MTTSKTNTKGTLITELPPFPVMSEYQELHDAINVLLEHGEISPTVYSKAQGCILHWQYKRQQLAPKIWTHGPDSIVFEWKHGGWIVDITVSAQGYSILSTTREQIEWRIDLP